jgi:hypothetical protein
MDGISIKFFEEHILCTFKDNEKGTYATITTYTRLKMLEFFLPKPKCSS